MGIGSANDCTTSVCGNVRSQLSVKNISGPAVVNLTSDVLAKNPSLKEITLSVFHDSSRQILLISYGNLMHITEFKMSGIPNNNPSHWSSFRPDC
jgi:hypothetical protein